MVGLARRLLKGLGLVKREKLYIFSRFDLDLPIFY